jgi:hypothetical protein
MFGKKKIEQSKITSERDLIRAAIKKEVENLVPGQTLIYRLPEFYWNDFAAFLMVEINPTFPQKGKKYSMSRDGIVNGQPAGKKQYSGNTNNPNDYVDWVQRREGQRYN